MKVYPVKLRNRPIPLRPVQLNVKFGYSKVKGEFPLDKCETQEERNKEVESYIVDQLGLTDEQIAEIGDEIEDL